jgi:hypothetical protein
MYIYIYIYISHSQITYTVLQIAGIRTYMMPAERMGSLNFSSSVLYPT